jgi:hypothetical protein
MMTLEITALFRLVLCRGVRSPKSLQVSLIRQTAAYNQELTSAMAAIKSFYGAWQARVNRIWHGRHSEKIYFRERL